MRAYKVGSLGNVTFEICYTVGVSFIGVQFSARLDGRSATFSHRRESLRDHCVLL